MGHVVLLGDSIFDNAKYVPGGPTVSRQLEDRLSDGWQVTLRAVDGDVARDVPGQLDRLPEDATHLVVSVGGNDALRESGILYESASRAAEVFQRLAEVQAQFRSDYQSMLRAVLEKKNQVVLCTIYDAIPGLSPMAVTGLSVFNDCILREAIGAGLPLLDLRLICKEWGDYSSVSPIEPSVAGGEKIAAAIVEVVTRHDFKRGRTVVYA